MIAVFVGYGSHFFADMMTLGGVQLFWPSRLIMDQKIRMTELPPATSAPYMRPVSLWRSNCGEAMLQEPHVRNKTPLLQDFWERARQDSNLRPSDS
jgi:hypothetical protein